MNEKIDLTQTKVEVRVTCKDCRGNGTISNPLYVQFLDAGGHSKYSFQDYCEAVGLSGIPENDFGKDLICIRCNGQGFKVEKVSLSEMFFQFRHLILNDETFDRALSDLINLAIARHLAES